MQKNRNGDGFIDREEFADILRSTGEPITEEEIEELMTDGDTNKDGKIDFDGKINISHINTYKYPFYCMHNFNLIQTMFAFTQVTHTHKHMSYSVLV